MKNKNRTMEEAERVMEKIRNNNWKELIKLQTMPNRDNYHVQVVNDVLYLLGKKKLVTNDPAKGETVYLISLVRYFGVKPLNNGFYFRHENDAEEFVRQYIKEMKINKDLEREAGEKIRLTEMKISLEITI